MSYCDRNNLPDIGAFLKFHWRDNDDSTTDSVDDDDCKGGSGKFGLFCFSEDEDFGLLLDALESE